MPCACGDIRIIDKKLQCPSCDSIVVSDSQPKIQELEQCLKDASAFLYSTLEGVNPEVLIEILAMEREKVAQRCLTDFLDKENELKRWLSISFLISKYPWNGNGLPNYGFVEYLISCAEEIIEFENDIYKLKKGLRKIVISDNKEKIVPTEFDVIQKIPEHVLNEYKNDDILTKRMAEKAEDATNADLLLIKAAMVQPGLPLIIGDEIYRHLKKNCSIRLLPNLRPANVNDFIEIALKFAGFTALQLGRDFSNNYGLLKISDQYMEQIKLAFKGESGSKVEWYLQQLERSTGSIRNLGQTIIIKTREGLVFLPYFSIYLEAHLCLRWGASSEKGEYYRYIGETVEDIIFSFVSAYSANTDHPLTGKPLLRVPWPGNRGKEIADVMVYDAHYLIVIESKFWETITVKDLELELEKFYDKIEYIKSNLIDFGFSPTLEVKPIFYVPYPPYNEWNGIKLIPSLILLGNEISKYFTPMTIKLSRKNKKLKQIIEAIKNATPYPVDLSLFDSAIPSNKYRVQDGVIESYDEEDVTAYIDNPIGQPTPLILDISKDVFRELRSKCIGKGDVIKMLVVNLNKTWSLVQLLDFTVIEKSAYLDIDTSGLLSILEVNSGSYAIEK